MINSILSAGFILGVFAMLFVTPVYFTRGLLKITYGELQTSDKIVSFIPVVNVIKAESAYMNRVSLVGLSTGALILTVLIRLLMVFVFTTAAVGAQTATVILFLVSLLAYYGSNVYIVFLVLHDLGIGEIWVQIFRAVFFPLGQFYIGSHAYTVYKNMSREADAI